MNNLFNNSRIVITFLKLLIFRFTNNIYVYFENNRNKEKIIVFISLK